MIWLVFSFRITKGLDEALSHEDDFEVVMRMRREAVVERGLDELERTRPPAAMNVSSPHDERIAALTAELSKRKKASTPPATVGFRDVFPVKGKLVAFPVVHVISTEQAIENVQIALEGERSLECT